MCVCACVCVCVCVCVFVLCDNVILLLISSRLHGQQILLLIQRFNRDHFLSKIALVVCAVMALVDKGC